MTPTEQKIEVMTHFVKQGKVQRRPRGFSDATWRDDRDPDWDWRLCEFRIKPEPRVFCGVPNPDRHSKIKAFLYETEEDARSAWGTQVNNSIKLVEDLSE